MGKVKKNMEKTFGDVGKSHQGGYKAQVFHDKRRLPVAMGDQDDRLQRGNYLEMLFSNLSGHLLMSIVAAFVAGWIVTATVAPYGVGSFTILAKYGPWSSLAGENDTFPAWMIDAGYKSELEIAGYTVRFDGDKAVIMDDMFEGDPAALAPLREFESGLRVRWYIAFAVGLLAGLAVFYGAFAGLATRLKRKFDMEWYEAEYDEAYKPRKDRKLIEQETSFRLYILYPLLCFIGGKPHYDKRLRMLENYATQLMANRHIEGPYIMDHDEFMETIKGYDAGVPADFGMFMFENQVTGKRILLKARNSWFLKHILFNGQTGHGKTTVLKLIINSITAKNRKWAREGKPCTYVILTDPKPEFGAFWTLFYRVMGENITRKAWKKLPGDRGLRLGLTDKLSEPWNIFAELLTSRDPKLACNQAARILVLGSSGSDSYFDNSARKIFAGLLYACVLDYRTNPRACTYDTLYEVLFRLEDADEMFPWSKAHALLMSHPETVKDAVDLPLSESAAKRTDSVWTTLQQKTDFLNLFDRWKDVLPEESFCLTRWVRSSVKGDQDPHLIMNYSDEFGKVVLPILHYWTSVAMTTSTTLPERKRGDNHIRVMFILDELVDLLGKVDAPDHPLIDAFLGVLMKGRSLGTSCVAAVQDMGALYDQKSIGEKRMDTVINNFSTKIVGKVDAPMTRRELSKLFGEKTIERAVATSSSGTEALSDRASYTWQQERVPVIPEHAITALEELHFFVMIKNALTEFKVNYIPTRDNGLPPIDYIDKSIKLFGEADHSGTFDLDSDDDMDFEE